MATKKKSKSAKLNDAAKKSKTSAGKKKAQPKQTLEIGNVGPPVEPATASVGNPPAEENKAAVGKINGGFVFFRF